MKRSYVCPVCGMLELEESIKSPVSEKCVYCGSRIRRTYCDVAVIYRTGGFYTTDKRKQREQDGL